MTKRASVRIAHAPVEDDELPKEVRDFLDSYRKFVTSYYGPRCKVRASGCPCCEAWALYDLTDTMTI